MTTFLETASSKNLLRKYGLKLKLGDVGRFHAEILDEQTGIRVGNRTWSAKGSYFHDVNHNQYKTFGRFLRHGVIEVFGDKLVVPYSEEEPAKRGRKRLTYVKDGHNLHFNCCGKTLAISTDEDSDIDNFVACPFCGRKTTKGKES